MEALHSFGYLFERNIRLANKFSPWITFPGIGIFSLLLWNEAIKHAFSLPFLALAIFWSCFSIWVAWRYHSVRCIVDVEYSCMQNKVINKYKDNTVIVFFDKTLFLTLVQLDFAYGKGIQSNAFYVISNIPISSNAIGYKQGLLLFKKLFKQGMIAIPKNALTQEWLFDTLKIKRVSEYPVVSCYIRNNVTKIGTGSLVPSGEPDTPED